MGDEQLEPEEVTSHSDCDFGKWLYGSEGQALKSSSFFKDVERHHEQVHFFAKQVVKQAKSGNKDNASALMNDFEKEREELFKALDKLYIS